MSFSLRRLSTKKFPPNFSLHRIHSNTSSSTLNTSINGDSKKNPAFETNLLLVFENKELEKKYIDYHYETKHLFWVYILAGLMYLQYILFDIDNMLFVVCDFLMSIFLFVASVFFIVLRRHKRWYELIISITFFLLEEYGFVYNQLRGLNSIQLIDNLYVSLLSIFSYDVFLTVVVILLLMRPRLLVYFCIGIINSGTSIIITLLFNRVMNMHTFVLGILFNQIICFILLYYVNNFSRQLFIEKVRLYNKYKLIKIENVQRLKLLENIYSKEFKIRNNLENKNYLVKVVNNGYVYQCDIKGFTRFTSLVSSDRIIFILNLIYSYVDTLIFELDLTKVHTIGDCLVAYSKNHDYQNKILLLGIGSVLAMKQLRERVTELKEFDVHIRVGIASGDFYLCKYGSLTDIANGFINFDIFGKAQLTANELEQNGIVGSVLVDEGLFEKTKNSFRYSDQSNKIGDDITSYILEVESRDIKEIIYSYEMMTNVEDVLNKCCIFDKSSSSYLNKKRVSMASVTKVKNLFDSVRRTETENDNISLFESLTVNKLKKKVFKKKWISDNGLVYPLLTFNSHEHEINCFKSTLNNCGKSNVLFYVHLFLFHCMIVIYLIGYQRTYHLFFHSVYIVDNLFIILVYLELFFCVIFFFVSFVFQNYQNIYYSFMCHGILLSLLLLEFVLMIFKDTPMFHDGMFYYFVNIFFSLVMNNTYHFNHKQVVFYCIYCIGLFYEFMNLMTILNFSGLFYEYLFFVFQLYFVVFVVFVIYILIKEKNVKISYNYKLMVKKQNKILNNEKKINGNLIYSIIPMNIFKIFSKINFKCFSLSLRNCFVVYLSLHNYHLDDYSSKYFEKRISFLCDLFLLFDEIVVKNEHTRIKTIQNSYIFISKSNDSTMNNVVLTSLIETVQECFSSFESLKLDCNYDFQDDCYLKCGLAYDKKVSSGIIGKSKLCYDIFGKSVNLSSRLCNFSYKNKINVADDNFSLMINRNKRKYFRLIKRGKFKLKGIGETDCSFLEGKYHRKYLISHLYYTRRCISILIPK